MGIPFAGGYGGGWGYANGLYGALDSYGSLNLTQQSPMQQFVEPLTIQELMTYMRLSDAEVDDDRTNELQIFISAAREQAEILQGRDLVLKQWDLSYDYWPGYRIHLRAPLVTVDLVQYTDSTGLVTVVPTSSYVVDTNKQPGTLSPPYNGTWPTFTGAPSSALLFRFTSGYSVNDAFWRDAGARIKMGMKMLINGWDSNRIPYEIGSTQANEYPYAVSSCLSYGSIVRAR